MNRQFIRNCDAVIAVFGSRFGSPTGQYQSGTEEEIEEMLQAGKQVFLYFSEIPKDLSRIDLNQLEKVKAIRQKYQSHGIYGLFKSLDEIEKKIHADLSLYFIQKQNTSAINVGLHQNSRESILEISSVEDHPCDDKQIRSSQVGRWTFEKLIKSTESSIISMIDEIKKRSASISRSYHVASSCQS